MRRDVSTSAAVLLAVALAGPACAAQPPAATAWPGAAIEVLLQQARFWQAHGQPTAAAASLNRVLGLQPGNADALAALATLEAGQGRLAAARATLARLRGAAPADPRLPRVTAAIRLGARPDTALVEARRLAAGHDAEAAVAQYEAILHGNPPPADLAVEYFRALRASGLHEAARSGLADLLREDPGDLGAQLAYAQTLTDRPDTRDEGFGRLRALAANRLVAADAGAALAAALHGNVAVAAAGPPSEPAPALVGDLPSTEAALRATLARRPGEAAATVALAELLEREGRAVDAATLRAGLQAVGAGRLVTEARAARLRDQAAAEPDPAGRLALLRAATATAPDNGWVRLDFARALVASHRLAEARAVMARGVAGGVGVDALRAGIIFANETADPAAAETLLARLPPGARTVDMRAARNLADLRQAVAAALGQPATARATVLSLAAGADVDGSRAATIALALAAGGQPDFAREALGVAAAGGLVPAARLAHAAALLDIGDAAAAETLLAGLPDAATQTLTQRVAATELRERLAIGRTDALRAAGQPAAAFAALAPALAVRPADPALNAALARLYRDAGRPREALAVAETALRQSPEHAELREVAVTAALAAGEATRADGLAREGTRITPAQPPAWLAVADLAEARGDNAAALRALLRARALRTRQREAAAGGLIEATATSATVLAVFAPGEMQPDAPTPDAVPETDIDGDQVVVRRRPLDTSATDLPPPEPAVAVRTAAPPPPGRPAVASAPAPAPPASGPVPSIMATSVQSGDPLAADPAADSGPFGRAAGTAPAESGTLANPFAPAGPQPAANVAVLAAPSTPADPMTSRIDQAIAALTPPPSPGAGFVARPDTAPTAQGGIGFRGRSGSPGTSQLAEITVPLEASFAAGEGGRISLAVTPTYLDSDDVPRRASTLGQFGTLALGVGPGAGPKRQTATGAGLDIGYNSSSFSADIGATPLGFREQNVIGGLEWAPRLGEGTRLRLTGERRAVTDSLLSYAGTRDPRTGTSWGGVTSSRGHANLEFSMAGQDLYVGGGGGVLEGDHVEQNTVFEAGAGGSVKLLHDPGRELRLGLDLVYFGFDKNLSGFTLGQGGYFSPQSYFAALLPLTWKEQASAALSYEIGGTAGIQTYREDASPAFANNAALQADLVARQTNPATAVPGVTTGLAAKNATGFAGGAHGAVDYRLTGGFHIGANVDYQHAGNYNQASGLLYGRYVFDGASRR